MSLPPSDPPPPPEVADFMRRVQASDSAQARLLRPLSPEQRGALADRWMASKGIRASSPAPARPRRRAGFGVGLALAAALAAAAGIVISRRDPPAPVASWLVLGEQQARGPASPEPGEPAIRVRPDTLLRVAISLDRPAAEVSFRLLVVRGGKAVPVPAERRTTYRNELSLEDSAEKLLGPQINGAAELVWIGGITGPDEATSAAIAQDPGREVPASLVVLRRAVVFEGWQETGFLDITGCSTMTRDGACELDERRTVTVWAKGSPGVLVDDRPFTPASRVESGSGMRIVVSPPPGARALTVTTGSLQGRVSLLDAPAMSPRRAQAEQILREGDLQKAEALLLGPAAGAPPELAERRLLARIARRRALAGEIPMIEAQRARLAVGHAAADAGRLSEAADDLLVTAYSRLTDTGDLAGAKALLDEAEGRAALAADTLTFWEYVHGLWARETGDLGTALGDLQSADERAGRLALGDLRGDVRSALPEVLALLGRVEEALEMSPAPSGRGCDAAVAATNRGWARLIGGGDVDQAAAELRDALDRAEGRCPDRLPILALNLSYAEEARGHHDEAAKWLSLARDATRPDDARLGIWQDRLAILLELSVSPARALRTAERLSRHGSAEIRFEAAFARARALRALGRADEVGAAFEGAEAELDTWLRTVHLGQGRDSLIARLNTAPQTWLTWLAEQTSRTAAERLRDGVLRNLSRGIRTLSAGNTPSESRSGPPPGAGELRLLVHPLATGVLVTAWSAGHLSHVRVARPTGAALLAAGALLTPFQADLERAAGVRLLVHPSLADLPFGAVEIGGRPLAERVPLSYGLGMAPAAREEPSPLTMRPRALVVLDPRGDLHGARRSRAPQDLAARGFDVDVLRGPDATRHRVREALQATCGGLFHYEGHGERRGIDGHTAGLALRDGILEVRRLRELRCVPRTVVLAACDVAQSSGFALAHAFVERGATAVLGAAASLDDDVAAGVMSRLYAGAAAAERFDLPAALASALRALREAGSPAGVAGLRVVVP